jgi:hypothetical protein
MITRQEKLPPFENGKRSQKRTALRAADPGGHVAMGDRIVTGNVSEKRYQVATSKCRPL